MVSAGTLRSVWTPWTPSTAAVFRRPRRPSETLFRTQAALAARARHRTALAALHAQVESEAAAGWDHLEIEAARAAALRYSLMEAATPPSASPPSLPDWPATTVDDVMRRRRLATEAIGFAPGSR